MKIKVSALMNILLSVVLVVSIAANLTGAVDYDPWLDVTDDGYGGIDDIVSTAEHFGASGDPTKLCNITNWPIHTEITVFWQHNLVPSDDIGSAWYEASGFSRIHMAIDGQLLGPGESVTIEIWGRIRYSTLYVARPYYTITLTESTPYRFQTVYIPSESFWFYAYTDSLSNCYVSLSFYLTWS